MREHLILGVALRRVFAGAAGSQPAERFDAAAMRQYTKDESPDWWNRVPEYDCISKPQFFELRYYTFPAGTTSAGGLENNSKESHRVPIVAEGIEGFRVP
jgi:hypothetical protein